MQNFGSFLESWNGFMRPAALSAAVIGLLIYLFYEMRLFLISDNKEKYDYMNRNEVRVFMLCALAYVVSGTLFINTVASSLVLNEGTFGLAIRAFISLCFFIVAYYFMANVIKVFYPTYLERRLNAIRRKPRISPSGNKMRLLSEEEEDVHLDEGMRAEENFFTVDYDVWIDDKSGFKLIEKYMAFQHAEQCSECSYFTLKEDWEKIIKPPTLSEQGQGQRHFTCQYCGHKESKIVPIAKLSTNVGSSQKMATAKI